MADAVTHALLRVGFVGLGKMGRPLARRLIAAGHDLVVYDVDSNATASFLAAYGGAAARLLAEVARDREVIITMLPDGAVVRRVVLGDDDKGSSGLLAAMTPGCVLVDMSSSAPAGTRELGSILLEHGMRMLDAPVSGGVVRAEAGTLAIMVGGEPAVVARYRPLLAALGAHVFETGRLGSGHALKALNNLVSAAGLLATAEALLIGRAFGLDPQVMIDVFNASSARNNSTEHKFKQQILSRQFASNFSLDLMVKDLNTAIGLAGAVGTPVPFASHCRDLWSAARSQLPDAADHTAVVQWLEEVAGVRL